MRSAKRRAVESRALLTLLPQLNEPDLVDRLIALTFLEYAAVPAVPVVGLVKRGKSTLVNTLCGAPVSTQKIRPETAGLIGVLRGSPRGLGLDIRGDTHRLPHDAAGFAAAASRESSGQFLAAVIRGHFTIPKGVMVVDTPGYLESGHSTAGAASRSPESHLFSVAPGAVVVLGIPGLHADDVKRLDHVRSKVADVAVVLKGLDSSIRMGDLEQYRDYLDLPADLVTVTACDEDERQIELLRGFLEDMRVADWDERLKAERNELETAVADAAARTGNVRPFDPTELKLRDLPDVVARALNEVSTKSHEQRTRERDAAAAAECRRQYDSQVSAWEMQVREAKLACNGQWARVGTRQRQIKALDEKTGCGMWMLLLASFALFPFGPVIWVVVRIVMSVKADERKAAQLPSQQYQLDIEMRELHRCQQVVAKLESQRPVLK